MKLNLLCESFNPYTGYGRMAYYFARTLLVLGVDVTPFLPVQAAWGGLLQRAAGIDFSRTTLAIMPHAEFPSLPGRVWGFTMWETSTLPSDKKQEWLKNINLHCERLIVPCEWNRQIFADAGVQVPIHVLPLGVDPAEFPIMPDVQRSRPYTFMTLGDRGSRKGHDLVWQAFYEAFGDLQDVRLIIKTRRDGMLIPASKEKLINMIDLSSFDQRVSIWREDADRLADVWSAADCFVFPSRGEGFGLPPRETAAMGIPTIASDHGGLAEGGTGNYAIPIPCAESKSLMNDDGLWASPDRQALKEAMQWCYENRAEAKQRALQAAQWIRDNQTWGHAAKSLLELMEIHT